MVLDRFVSIKSIFSVYAVLDLITFFLVFLAFLRGRILKAKKTPHRKKKLATCHVKIEVKSIQRDFSFLS